MKRTQKPDLPSLDPFADDDDPNAERNRTVKLPSPKKQDNPDQNAGANDGGILAADKLELFKAATVFIVSGDPRRDPNAATGSGFVISQNDDCLLYTSPSPRDS